jgi:dTDP-glucose pyrophosphorylase
MALIREITIGPGASIHDAIAQLTQTERRILLVCDQSGTLLGTITDYDIRRAILAGLLFDAQVQQIMATKPVVLRAGQSEADINAFMRRSRAHYVPIVDASNRVVDKSFLQELIRADTPEERVAVIMAGGFGHRMRPYTEDLPKPMLSVGGRPILFTIIDQIIAEGFTQAYICVHYKSDVIVRAIEKVEHYRDFVTFVHEREPLGTAGGLSLLPERPSRPFLVINGDVVTQVPLQEMCHYHERDGNFITIATKLDHHTVPFGVIEVADSRVSAVIEKPKVEYIVSIGAYVLEPSALDGIAKDKSLDMPDLINRVLRGGAAVGSFPVHEYWLDVGTPEQYEKANAEIATLKIGRAG